MVSRQALFFFLPIILLPFFSAPVCGNEPPPEDPGIFENSSVVELITAEREIKEKLGKDPGNAALYFELSNVCAALFDRTRKKNSQSLGWLVKSGDALEKTLMIEPGHEIAHYNLGVVYKRQGKMERAREELKKAIRYSEEKESVYFLAACWMQIGTIYAEQGFYDEAEDSFEKALEYDYGSEDIRSALEEVKAAKKSGSSGELSGSLGDSSLFSGMMPRASHDPYANNLAGLDQNTSGGVAQAIPYLGQMLAQKFTGGGGGSNDDSLQ